MPKFPKNKHFLPPDTHTYVRVSGDKKGLFFGNFGMLCFLETPVLRSVILSYYRRVKEITELDHFLESAEENNCHMTKSFEPDTDSGFFYEKMITNLKGEVTFLRGPNK